jgi:hypothetical protein
MKTMMKKAAMGMQTKPKKGKMISESGDLADALNETKRMREAGKAPKTDKDAGKFMDKLNKEGKLGPAKPKMKMGGPLKDVPAGNAGLPKLPTPVRNKMGFKKNGGAMKKAMMGSSMMADPMMKKGGAMKKCKYGCK